MAQGRCSPTRRGKAASNRSLIPTYRNAWAESMRGVTRPGPAEQSLRRQIRDRACRRVRTASKVSARRHLLCFRSLFISSFAFLLSDGRREQQRQKQVM